MGTNAMTISLEVPNRANLPEAVMEAVSTTVSLIIKNIESTALTHSMFTEREVEAYLWSTLAAYGEWRDEMLSRK